MSATPVQAERILDLSFWPVEQSELALGGLWEFHAQKLLDPAQRLTTSEILVDISDSWTRFRLDAEPLQRASYVMLIRGLPPRAAGYSVNVPGADPGTTLIVAPKYATAEKRVVFTPKFPAFFAFFSGFLRSPLRLTFTPHDADEIWLLIVQRQLSPSAAAAAIPRLSAAEAKRPRR